MPWDCTTCGSVAVLDDEPVCPGCGGAKAAWTMHADRTRTFRTARREKLELLRGGAHAPVEQAAGYPDDVALAPARAAVSLDKASARSLAARGLLPAPAHVLVARLHPRPGQDPGLQTTVLFEAQEVAPEDHPREPLTEPGALDAWFVLVHGPEPADDLAFPGLTVLDVTEAALEAGHAPQVGVAGLGGRRKDLPIEPLVLAHLHARLLCEPGEAPAGPADLAWEKDGQPVTEADGLPLPAEAGEDGVLRAHDLPWGDYTVQATLREPLDAHDGRALERAALPLLARPDDEPHLQWVRLAPRRGHLHARLVHPCGFFVGEADLAWERDGEPVVADDLGLPAGLDADGVLRARDLPWGVYTVQPALRAPPRGLAGRPLARVALPLLAREDPEPHLQRVPFAGRRARPALDEDDPDEGSLHAVLLLDPDGARIERATLSWAADDVSRLPDEVGAGGVIRVDGLPPGDYVVSATLPDGRRTAPVALPLLAAPDDEPHLQWARLAGGGAR
ncbi:MAG: hypothetical protein M9894_30745 [Planctomycetes bacterium]|nr:hypothetical protein [Planctomycetota bacterium]